MADLADDQTPLKKRGRSAPLSDKWTNILDGRVWFIPDTDFTSISAIRSSASAAAAKRGKEAAVRKVDGGVLVQGYAKKSAGGGAPGEPDPPAPTTELPGGRDGD